MGRYLYLFGGVQNPWRKEYHGRICDDWITELMCMTMRSTIQHKMKKQLHSPLLYHSSTSKLNKQHWVSDMHITAHAR